MTTNEHIAKVKGTNLSISTKQCVEICNVIRFTPLATSKVFLEDVIAMRKAVPFRKFNRDTGHKRGPIAAGRYPIKACKEILTLLKSVESNAQAKGLNSNNLKITKIVANKASIPQTGGRHRQGTRRSHVEIEVQEYKGKKAKKTEAKIPATKETTSKPVKKDTKSTPIKEAAESVKEETKETSSGPVEEEKIEEEVAQESTTDESQSEEQIPITEPVEEEKTEETPTGPAEKKEALQSEEPIPVTEPVEEKIEETPVEEVAKSEPTPKVKSSKEEKPTAKEQLVEEPTPKIIKEIPIQMQLKEVQDLSPEDLLKKAQQHAAMLNKKESKDKETKEVENLYEQLQKKGSLRGSK